jgi:hypothetical protein
VRDYWSCKALTDARLRLSERGQSLKFEIALEFSRVSENCAFRHQFSKTLPEHSDTYTEAGGPDSGRFNNLVVPTWCNSTPVAMGGLAIVSGSAATLAATASWVFRNHLPFPAFVALVHAACSGFVVSICASDMFCDQTASITQKVSAACVLSTYQDRPQLEFDLKKNLDVLFLALQHFVLTIA